ncbi:MAG: protein phosphatase 2C domain-containing protein, partial [Candidatus Promineifilaceae bacterium]|nr:protein phosphatase 2C domain-containing protein [Candidatus Promineifilaceae bacterium]
MQEGFASERTASREAASSAEQDEKERSGEARRSAGATGGDTATAKGRAETKEQAEVEDDAEGGQKSERAVTKAQSKMARSDAAQTDGGESFMLVARRSHVGRVRQRNEDACFTFVSQSAGYEALPLFGLFIVADGMGGHLDGHRASQIVSRTVAEYALRTLYQPLLENGGATLRYSFQEIMEEAVLKANKALYIPEPQKAMGSTLTAALVLGSRLFLAHVGDSRAYLLQDDALMAITTDHSVVRALQDSGQLTDEEVAHYSNRSLLYRALVGDELEGVDTYTRTLPARGLLMLCSDGLWDLL